ncbi:MAG: hypothetical protein LBB50_06000, partial [Oscillospiraceae bacterium]|nr:hypothetical protein [Oscillospiraceae bacterium]
VFFVISLIRFLSQKIPVFFLVRGVAVCLLLYHDTSPTQNSQLVWREKHAGFLRKKMNPHLLEIIHRRAGKYCHIVSALFHFSRCRAAAAP